MFDGDDLRLVAEDCAAQLDGELEFAADDGESPRRGGALSGNGNGFVLKICFVQFKWF